MQQVLFRIPLKVDWLPFGLPLWAVLLVLFLGAAAALYAGARHAARWKLDPKSVQGAAVWVGVAGLIVAGLALGFADSGLPIYGFGMMLFLAFVVCNWIGGRRAAAEGVAQETIQDLAIWLIIGGLIGARLTSTLWPQEGEGPFDRIQKVLADPRPFLGDFVQIWNGGIVLYGAVIGGLVSYGVAYFLVFRKKGVPTLKLADILAPCLAIGLCLGRIGCFLNGCCYGQVAAADAPIAGVSFPLSAPPRNDYLVANGYQTAAGFTFVAGGGAVVDKIEPKSPQEMLDLKQGDVIVQVDDTPVWTRDDFLRYLNDPPAWPRGKNNLKLVIHSAAGRHEAVIPWKLGAAPLPIPFSPTPAPAPPLVDRVERDSAAAKAGLKPGDRIEQADDQTLVVAADLDKYIGKFGSLPRGKNDLTLTVLHEGAQEPQTIHLWPWTLRLHPTQLYETVSMFLLFWVLTFYYPLRRHDGQVMAVLMIGYSIHRYLNELLRADVRPVGFESWTSVILFAAGVALWVWLAWRPAQYPIRVTAEASGRREPADEASSAGSRRPLTGVSPASTTATSAVRPAARRNGR